MHRIRVWDAFLAETFNGDTELIGYLKRVAVAMVRKPVQPYQRRRVPRAELDCMERTSPAKFEDRYGGRP